MASFEHFFTKKYKLEQWVKIEQTYIKFLLRRRPLEKSVLEEIISKLNVTPFEFLGNTAGIEDEFVAFRRVMLSKVSSINEPCFVQGIPYENFIAISNALFIKDCTESIISLLSNLREKLKELAFRYKMLPQVGRTHGIHAEPTSFGHKFAVCYSDLSRSIESIYELRKYIEVLVVDFEKIHISKLGLELQDYMAEELGLFFYSSNSCKFRRRRYINFLGNINTLVQVINKLVFDLNLLSQDEIVEVNLSSELRESLNRVELSAKLIDSNYESFVSLNDVMGKENKSFLEVEETLLKNTMQEVFVALSKTLEVLEKFEVNEFAIDKHISLSGDIIYSQLLMLYLLRKGDFSRKEILKDIRDIAHRVTRGEVTFSFALITSEKYSKYFPKETLESLMKSENYLRNIDDVYVRIFGKNSDTNPIKKVVWNEWEINSYIDKLADKINREYEGEQNFISVVGFSERSLVFLGNLLLKFKFPVVVNTLNHNREDLDIKKIELDSSLVQSRRILIVDYMVNNSSTLDNFINKLKENIFVKDVKVCSLLKFNDFNSENFSVDWCAIECSPDEFYAGFGKNSWSDESCRNIPYIGTPM